VKCPPKNTGLCLAKYSANHAKGADLASSNKTFKAANTPLNMDRKYVGGEEFQRAGTENAQ